MATKASTANTLELVLPVERAVLGVAMPAMAVAMARTTVTTRTTTTTTTTQKEGKVKRRAPSGGEYHTVPVSGMIRKKIKEKGGEERRKMLLFF